MFFKALQRVVVTLGLLAALSTAQSKPLSAIHDITREKVNLNGFNMRMSCFLK
jgi:hypothetical protein